MLIKSIQCRGTIPHTTKRCDAELCLTDGEYFYPKGEIKLKAIGRTLAIICPKCGYSTKLVAGFARNYCK